MTNLKKLTWACLSVLALHAQPALACTDFSLRTADGAVICGRSMEWAVPLRSKLQFHPKGEHPMFSYVGSDNESIPNKYGYVAADALGVSCVVDGMNEAGLSYDALWLPGSEYTAIPQTGPAKCITNLELGAWLLGSFATVDEAVSAIRGVRVIAVPMAELGGIPTLHVALHDAGGKNAVIEFIDGQQKIYDNPNGVLTNAPTFDWHMTNLRNYIHVDAANPKPVVVAGTVLAPPGQGSGFLGIPGDWTPPSRFVRTTAMRAFSKQPATARDGAILSAHILNAVDIPKGAIRDQSGANAHTDYTQWAIVKDLTNKKLWYRGYNDMGLKSIDLSKIDFASNAKLPAALPMDSEP